MKDEAAAGSEADTAARAKEVTPGATAKRPWLAALLLFVVIVGGSYCAYVYVIAPAHEKLERRIGEVAARQSAQNQVAATTAAQLVELADSRAASDGRMDRLAEAQEDLRGAIGRLYARHADVSLNWILAEAEYLILAAQQRLILERDVLAAAAALRAADERIRSAQQPSLIPLRQQLTRDLAALDATEQPDIEGLALYLAEAVAQVDDLPTKPIAELETSFARTRDIDPTTNDWRDTARALWADLRSLVEIKDGELSDGVLFDPKLRYFLLQNLRLELSSARLAVLRRDDGNFRAAARLVRELLHEYYDVDNAAVRAISARVETAASKPLAPELPDITGSLTAVRELRAGLESDAAAIGSK